MAWQGVEIEIQVPCAGGQKHPVRLRFTGWGEFEVAYNPCEELLGPVFARMAACTHYLHEAFPEAFRNDTDLKRRLVGAFGAAGAPAIPALIQALGDSDRDVRWVAAKALGKLGDPQAIPALSVWAHAGEDAARDALQTLGHPMLDLPQAVAQVAAQGAWGVLIRALTCTQVREVVVGLGAPAVPALIQALGDSDSAVRRAAAEALGAIGDLQAVPALIQALGDWRSENVRCAAAEALGKLGDPQAVPAFIKALGDSDRAVRRAAAEALVKIGTPAVPAFIKALGDSDRAVRRAAAEALGAIGDPQAVPALIQALGDRGENVRRAAGEALVRIGAPAVPALIKALGDSIWDVRRAAAEALGAIGDPQAVPALIKALGDSVWDVRRAAAEALGAIGDPQAVPPRSSKHWGTRPTPSRMIGMFAVRQRRRW